jgi:metal-sulfur cluster biosynthetic enzyme
MAKQCMTLGQIKVWAEAMTNIGITDNCEVKARVTPRGHIREMTVTQRHITMHVQPDETQGE